MSVFTSIFSKKKKEFKAFCALSQEPLEKGYGYLLTTSEVVSSKKYWDNIMTEPDTLSYTINHFTKQDKTATQVRKMIFDKYSSRSEPWMVSDSFISWFSVDREKARTEAVQWWDRDGEYEPKESGTAVETLPEDKFVEIRNYAIMEAGKNRMELNS